MLISATMLTAMSTSMAPPCRPPCLPPCPPPVAPCPTPCWLLFLLVGHHVRLHVGHHVHIHVGHHNVVSTLCEGSETLTEWKSESVREAPFELTRSTFGHCPNRGWTIYTSTITFISINVFAQMLLRRLIWSQRRHDTAESEARGEIC